MKKNILILVSCFFTLLSYSQSYVIPNELVNEFIGTDAANVKYSDAIIKSKVDADNFYEITLMYGGEEKSFKLKPLTFPYFSSKFKTVFSELIGTVKDNTAKKDYLVVKNPISKDVDKHIAFLFTEIVTYLNTEEERPEVATIHLKKNIPVYYTNKDSLKSIGELENVSVEISFYGGFIEKIQVNGSLYKEPMSFNNKYSIGISSTRNISQLSGYRLFTNERFSDKQFKYFESLKGLNKLITIDTSTIAKLNKTLETDLLSTLNDKEAIKLLLNNALYKQRTNTEKLPLMVYVDDIIRYVKKVDVNANDISPVPQLVILDKDQEQTKLYREESSKLFEAKVYSDFLGVFDEENPNGIIQTEISKAFNLSTRRGDFLDKFIEGFGWFQQFEAQFQFSKIEKNNKFLIPSTFETMDELGNVTTESFYSPINLYQYRNFAIGGMLNILTFENQNAKTNTFLSGGFLFGRTGVKENSLQEVGVFVNNLEIPIELKVLLLPEKRISFYIADRLSWFENFDADLPLMSIEDDKLSNKNRFLNTFDVGLNLDISSTGKLFLRYKLIHELDVINTNFSQLQFGYSFYLLKKNGVKAKE